MIKNSIAVIGGNGFLGSRITERFKMNSLDYKVFDINADNSDHFVDVADINTLEILKNFDVLINLAAVHRDDVKPISKYDDVNVKGAENICKIAKKYNIPSIIFTSSVAIFGFASEEVDETGEANFFNDYGRTKYQAEQVYLRWYNEDPVNRNLVIIRPTVIFGEGNRGNVFTLLNQIANKRFIMVGNGKNKKSMAYVENVAAFVEYALSIKQGIHIYNYIDKPDFDMNTLVSLSRKVLFDKDGVGLRVPAFLGYIIGYLADLTSWVTRKNLAVSSIRIKKFLGTTQFTSSIKEKENFKAPVSLEEGIVKTLKYEFIEDNAHKQTFETE